MSTYKGKDDCTDTILDLISEQESRGNYNAVIGHVYGLPGIELSHLTIRQIYSVMDGLLNGRYGKRMPSTAVGRYQIIRRTFKNVAANLRLKDTDKFTHELQDRMAVELLKGRGYQKWWLRKLTTIDFVHQLSCEWASLPDPYKGGKSHYEGLAGNHAGMTLLHVYHTLDRARTLMPHGS